jgi:uncharacterized protein YjbI with pentapeptide repeats
VIDKYIEESRKTTERTVQAGAAAISSGAKVGRNIEQMKKFESANDLPDWALRERAEYDKLEKEDRARIDVEYRTMMHAFAAAWRFRQSEEETTMKFEIKHGRKAEVLFSAELSAEFETESYALQIGAAVKLAVAARADLADADLAGADARANLARADLAGAYLARADLAVADLAGADARANLARADLAGAYLARADLADADLAGANLARADLTGAYLARADLAGADLAGANLARAYLASGYHADAQ